MRQRRLAAPPLGRDVGQRFEPTAAIAATHDVALVTRDTAMSDRVVGLRVEAW